MKVPKQEHDPWKPVMHVKRDVYYKMCGTHELSVAFRENHDIEQIGRTGTLVSFFALRFCLCDK